jgi:hypothetical protein
MAMLVARLSLNNIRFLTHHPRRWASIEQTPLSERQWIWEISINILKQQNMVLSNPLLKQFSWHATYFQQWHVTIHVLDALRANPFIADADKVWQLVSDIYENSPEMVFDTKKPIHVAVGSLCLKAYSSRETALQNGNMCLPPTPKFIMELRQQREIAKAKRQARDAASRQPANLVRPSQANANDMSEGGNTSAIYSRDILESPIPQQSITSYQPNPAPSEDDLFWSTNGFYDTQVGNLNDVINIDEDFSTDDNAAQTITWEQWDAWLADSNLIPPLSSVPDLREST